MVIISILKTFLTHIVTLPFNQSLLFCNSCFKLLIIATEPVSNIEGLLISTSKVNINNLYIKYTFVHFAILLIRQLFGVVLLPVIIPFAVEALSFRFRSSFGLLHGSDNLLVILLEVPFLSLCPFLETRGFVNHQHLMLFLDFYLP